MPTNANAFNSRVTSELLEKKFREAFPSQGGAELVQDLYAQGVIVPVVDFTDAAEGTVLSQNLQTAWDFSTGSAQIANTTTTLISNPGFWQIGVSFVTFPSSSAGAGTTRIRINDGATTKNVWAVTEDTIGINEADMIQPANFVVFLRAGDTLEGVSPNAFSVLDVWYRQIADVYGTLVNPLGYTPQ